MERKTYTIDASEKMLGRLATEVVLLLRGKDKPDFEYREDRGNSVSIFNIDKIKVSGKKADQKIYYKHSGYHGGLKKTIYKNLFAKNPAEVLRKAVYNMLPKNRLRPQMIKRLTIVAGPLKEKAVKI